MFERLRDALRAALDAATPAGDVRDLARQMREAVIEAKVAVREMREALDRTDRELAGERQRLADAERRGRLAGEIQDEETTRVAERFAAKHRERVGVLERKRSPRRSAAPSAPGVICSRQAASAPASIRRATASRPISIVRHGKPRPTDSSARSRSA